VVIGQRKRMGMEQIRNLFDLSAFIFHSYLSYCNRGSVYLHLLWSSCIFFDYFSFKM
jgi:hypothetical protein